MEMNQMDQMSERNPRLLLRVGEAADLLSIARSKAYLMIQSGELPGVRLGRSLRVPVAALMELLDRLQGASGQQP
jgi:excisionase family DNA binding protein